MGGRASNGDARFSVKLPALLQLRKLLYARKSPEAHRIRVGDRPRLCGALHRTVSQGNRRERMDAQDTVNWQENIASE